MRNRQHELELEITEDVMLPGSRFFFWALRDLTTASEGLHKGCTKIDEALCKSVSSGFRVLGSTNVKGLPHVFLVGTQDRMLYRLRRVQGFGFKVWA